MPGFDNAIVYSNGERLLPSSAADITRMQQEATDIAAVNYTGNPEGNVSANPGSTSQDPVSGNIYFKQTGTGNTGWIRSAPGAKTKITQFDADGSWTMDAQTVKLDMFGWGGGTGGAAGRNGVSGSASGGNGGAGAFVLASYQASSLSSSPYAVTIGQGGAGAASQSGTNTAASPGAPGTPTTVGSIFNSGFAPGVAGRSTVYSQTSDISAGAGNNGTGSPVTSIVYASHTAGGGAPGYASGSARVGRAGGNCMDGSGNTVVAGGLAGSSAGGNGGDGNSPPAGAPLHVGGTGGGTGGNSGDAVTPVAGNGGNGGIPGGGGGGGAGNLNLMASGAGGNGARGRLIIVEYF